VDPARGVATVKVEATDLVGILKGKVTYTQGNGQWQSVDLAYNTSAMQGKWVAEIPVTSGTRYYVQMVDNAGNVTVANNKGRYYDVGVTGVQAGG